MRLFELIGLAGTAATAAQTRYAEALALYRATRFADAAALLAHASDGPARWLAARCRALAAERPADWQPVTQLDAK